MDNIKNLEYYKNNLELYSNNLMKLVTSLAKDEVLNTNTINYATPCTIWKIIKYFLVGEGYDLSGLKTELKFKENLDFSLNNGILNEICCELESLINSNYIKSCKLKEELKEASKIFKCLIEAIKQVNCNDKCEFLVGKLFCLLVKIILLIVAIITKIILLLIFCNDCDKCNDDKDVNSYFCKCLICDLEEELNRAEELIDELIKLAIEFIKYSSKRCKYDKCYEDEYCNTCYEKSSYLNKCDYNLHESLDKFKK
ncbi:UNVERIFIED_CONTAM: hypothetical protein C3P01_17465 [Clostridioides difficile]|uniref:hypothetical protein n=1 Tax=Clostridioides difficile TaxID=1496 RepID=UPI0005E9EC21|nr:hypothetical protein [Clostridioides difficile]KJF64981.1 hypothetical protein TZ54_02540 [Clostridioides difficile]MBZ0779290.1 hypothetical protein [Clostridioides difficile]MBZ0856759.1 hypothetical protein [Clostridioides difficile]MCG7699821.1 hypothetical protein [Clostridioides difficile]MCK3746424.1 hypothetical protein [Clostridioides difficile]